MKRRDFERAVRQSELNPYARFVCMTYAARNNYDGDSQEISHPSMALVAEWTGMNKDTVKAYVDALVEDGWLVPAKMFGRTQGFYLEEGKVNHRQLRKVSRKMNFKDKQSPDGQEIQVGGLSPDGADLSPDGQENLSPDGAGVSPDGQELRTSKNHIEEPKEEPLGTAVAFAPTVPLTDSEDSGSLNSQQQSAVPTQLMGAAYLQKKREEAYEREQAKMGKYRYEDWLND